MPLVSPVDAGGIPSSRPYDAAVTEEPSSPALTPVRWQATGDGEHPYRAAVGPERWVLRVNDFPAEPLYTLIVDGAERLDLEDWPPAWRRPGALDPGQPPA